ESGQATVGGRARAGCSRSLSWYIPGAERGRLPRRLDDPPGPAGARFADRRYGCTVRAGVPGAGRQRELPARGERVDGRRAAERRQGCLHAESAPLPDPDRPLAVAGGARDRGARAGDRDAPRRSRSGAARVVAYKEVTPMARHTERRVRGPIVGLLAGYALWAMLGGTAWAKPPRPVLILPYQSTETDAWVGEAIAETLFLAAQGTPALLPIDRARVAQAGRMTGTEGAADTTPLGVARAVKAEIVFLGDYQRTSAGITITPKLLDVKTGQIQTLDPVRGPSDKLIETQATLIQSYAKALNLGLKG